MERKILFAVDGTEKGLESVSVVGRLLKDQADLQLVLFHCVQQLASLLPGSVCLDVKERCEISFHDQQAVWTAVMDESLKRLVEAGFPRDRVEPRMKLDSADPAHDIIAEAQNENTRTIALGRRGRSQVEALLLGGVSGKVAHYSQHKTIWIVDAPINESGKVMIAMEDGVEARQLTQYAAEYVAPSPGLRFTLLHFMPPVPPMFWDNGHILGPSEEKDRQSRIEKWRADWKDRVSRFMIEAKGMLTAAGVPEENVETLILPARLGVARDLLNEIDAGKFQMVIMGKRSLHERKPFLMGSHANRVVLNAKGVVMCLIDS